MLALLILRVLCCTRWICAEQHEMRRFINQLNGFFNFDHIIFLFDSSANIDFFIEISVTPQSLYVFHTTDDKIIGLDGLQEIKSKNALMIVVPGSVKLEDNLKLLSKIKEIQYSDINTKIGIFYPQSASMADVQSLFEWSWNQWIIYIFAATHSQHQELMVSHPENSLNIFTFNPFGTLKVNNFTVRDSFDNLFLSQSSNLQEYPVYSYADDPVLDYDKKWWRTIRDVMNVSLKFTNSTPVLGKFYVRLDRVALVRFPPRNCLYPWSTEQMVIVVPEALPYPGFAAYVKVFSTYSILGYTFVAVASIIFFLIVFRFKKYKKLLFFQSVADVFNILMNNNQFIKYRRLSGIEVLIIVPLTFTGLITVNGILSLLKSFLTSPIIQPQIDTAEDLSNSPFFIYTTDEYWVGIISETLTTLFPNVNWSDKMRTMKIDLLRQERKTVNTSKAFLNGLGNAKTLLSVQKKLKIRGYHIPRMRLGFMHGTYLLNKEDFPFMERMNEIVHRLCHSGIWELWNAIHLHDFERHAIQLNSANLGKIEDANNNDHIEMLKFIVSCWIASTVVFAFEIIWKIFNFRKLLQSR